MLEVIFDLETKKFFDETGTTNPADLGVSIVGLYFRETNGEEELKGELVSFWEKDFDKMWKIFRDADRIVGFNSKNFDIPALAPYAPADFAHLSHFDILEKIKEIIDRRVSLNRIAKDTLGTTKTDNPANATVYFQSGDPESLAKLKSYCEADVILTRDVYDFALKNKFLKFTDYWNNPRQVEVDFSYPAGSLKTQTSLF